MAEKLTPRGKGYILALGFGTSAAMWAVGYVLRIPPAPAPSWLVLLLLAASLVGGGYFAGRYSGFGVFSGLYTGLVTSVVNLLILGSLLSEGNISVGVTGSIIATTALGLLGSAIGSRAFDPKKTSPNWISIFAIVAVGTTFLLIIAGGLVTSMEAGLAVVDWPNTEGQMMFLYPLAKMTGGIFYEHSHRLIGSLVGLTTLMLALQVQFSKQPIRLKWICWAALAMVSIQGLLGGLRVTGVFTASVDPADTAPNIILAIVHGVVGQMFLGLLVAIAVMTTKQWMESNSQLSAPYTSTDRGMAIAVVVLLVCQLTLGAVLRHVFELLHIHITLAVIVIGLCLTLGLRLWGIYTEHPLLQGLGKGMMLLSATQLVLGFTALIATGANQGLDPQAYMVVLATAHQTVGALLLAWAVLTMVWVFRILAPGNADVPAGQIA